MKDSGKFIGKGGRGIVKKTRRLHLLLAISMVGVLSGCESTTRQMTLELTPPSATLVPEGSVLFTARVPDAERETREIFLPLVWSVSDTGLGWIVNAAGSSAVYVAGTGEGVNTVTVRDQSGAEGIASVTQNR